MSQDRYQTDVALAILALEECRARIQAAKADLARAEKAEEAAQDRITQMLQPLLCERARDAFKTHPHCADMQADRVRLEGGLLAVPVLYHRKGEAEPFLAGTLKLAP
jgi:hypothetical protein